MALSLDYNDLTTSIINYLAFNSSTVNNSLSMSLTTIQEMRVDDYRLYARQFPALSVDLKSHEEERLEIGAGMKSRREITCLWEIGCHIKLMASYTAVYQEMKKLVQNTEFAIRKDDTLSSTFDQVDIINADFGTIVAGKNGNFQKNGMITLETINFIT